jgi:hypothetical protein
MAARFDASRARALGQNVGDGTPIMLTIPTKEPWVPLHILSLGLDKNQVVDADVFLLTDRQPKLLAGGGGLSLSRNEPASPLLLDDLRSDKHMGWVPSSMWFTYLHLNVPAGQLGYDLAISQDANPSAVPSLRDTGVSADQARPIVETTPFPWTSVIISLLLGAAVFFGLTAMGRRRPQALAS